MKDIKALRDTESDKDKSCFMEGEVSKLLYLDSLMDIFDKPGICLTGHPRNGFKIQFCFTSLSFYLLSCYLKVNHRSLILCQSLIIG